MCSSSPTIFTPPPQPKMPSTIFSKSAVHLENKARMGVKSVYHRKSGRNRRAGFKDILRGQGLKGLRLSSYGAY